MSAGHAGIPTEPSFPETRPIVHSASAHGRDRLDLLLNLSTTMTSAVDFRDLLRAIATTLCGVSPCHWAGIVLPDPATKELRLYGLDTLGAERKPPEGTPVPRSAPAAVFRSGEPLVADRFCDLPLISRGRVVGVLSLSSRDEGAFRSDDVEFLRRAAGQIAIAVDNGLVHDEVHELKQTLAREKVYLEDEIRHEMNFDEIIGTSALLRGVLKHVATVAPTDSTVLIHGETGTGKELIARAIHNLSRRQAHTFVKLNCAAIPTGLLESELFGHERGAFTGAIAQRIGRFELANRGTVFLDEVGEIPLELQTKLLRVLQEREFERLGSSRTMKSDARLIAATNRDLATMVDEQRFRADLYYRLNVFPVRVPALRERPEDIPLLVRHFVQQFAKRMNRTIETIPSETMDALVRYRWPGNIREMQNLIERAVILSSGRLLRVPLEDVQAGLTGNRDPLVHQSLADAERAHIVAILKETGCIVSGPHGAATRLGMNRSTLQFRMKKLGITRRVVMAG